MVKTVNLGGRLIGQGHPCFIIAEAGVNHNEQPELALDLIRAAADGTDPIKEGVWSAYQRWYHTQGGPLPEGTDATNGNSWTVITLASGDYGPDGLYDVWGLPDGTLRAVGAAQGPGKRLGVVYSRRP